MVRISLLIGGGLRLVEAVGIVVVGHFSLDGQLKREHFTERHHNMFVTENRCSLMNKLVNLLSFTSQTVVEIITELCYSGKTIILLLDSLLKNVPCNA